MKYCTYCGKENEDAAARCGECGTEEFTSTARVAPVSSFGTMRRGHRRGGIACIVGIADGSVALGLRTYDLIFVKFSAIETVHAVLLLVVVCSLFLRLRRDKSRNNIHGNDDNAA